MNGPESFLSIIETTSERETPELDGPLRRLGGAAAFRALTRDRGSISPAIEIDITGRCIGPENWVEFGVGYGAVGRVSHGYPTVESLGFVPGTDYLRIHDTAALFTGGLPVSPRPHLYENVVLWRPYHGPIMNSQAVAAQWCAPARHRRAVLWAHVEGRNNANEHDRLLVLWLLDESTMVNEHLGVFDPRGPMGFITHALWSPDDRYVLLQNEFGGVVHLLDVALRTVHELPIQSRAIDWDPFTGDLVALNPTDDHQLRVHRFELASGRVDPMWTIPIPAVDPIFFRHLRMHPFEPIAALIGPLGCSVEYQNEVRGGVGIACLLDAQSRRIEPVMSTSFPTTSAFERKHDAVAWRPSKPASAPASSKAAIDLGRYPQVEAHPCHVTRTDANRPGIAKLLTEAAFALTYQDPMNANGIRIRNAAVATDVDTAQETLGALRDEFYPLRLSPVRTMSTETLGAALEKCLESVLTAADATTFRAALGPVSELDRHDGMFWSAAIHAVRNGSAHHILGLAAVALRWHELAARSASPYVLSLPSPAERCHLYTLAVFNATSVAPNTVFGFEGARLITAEDLASELHAALDQFIDRS
jgi:hypothetical protein